MRVPRLALLLLLAMGCSRPAPPASGPSRSEAAAPANSATATPAPPVFLRIGLNTPGASVAPYWIAKEQGFLARRGIDAELVVVGGAERLMAAMIAGDIGIAAIAAPALLTAVVGGADLVLLGSYTNQVRFRLLGRPEIASVRDLRGKQIAITGRGGIIRRSTEIVLERNGVDPEREVTFIALGTVNEALAALLGGAVDASMQGPPNMFRAEDEGMRLLADTADYDYLTVQQGIAARRPWVAEHPELVRGTLQALGEAIAFAHQQPERTREVIARNTQSDDARLIERTLATLLPVWERDLRVPPEALAGDLEAAAQEVPSARGMRPDQFIDSIFVEALAREGFFARLYP
jgi:ABC-type nitrate/sulfonate/bicarbonate transport system substrate-binding protein